MMNPCDRRPVAGFALIVLAVAGWGGSAFGQDAATRIDEYLLEQADRRQFSGSVLVMKAGRVVVRKGYGFANLEHLVPNTPETRFRLGSITKPFTAMAILMLQEQGRLNTSDPIARHLSDVPPSWQALTIHHLLTHTSGLAHAWELPDFKPTMRVPSTPDQVYARYKAEPLLFEPGRAFHYSGIGYYLLARIIESASGKPYGAFLQEHIFDPLDMKDTGEDHPAPVLPCRAIGYRRVGDRIEHDIPVDMPRLTGGGNLVSTVDDLSKWDRALAAGSLLAPASYEALYAPERNHYAYGWNVRTDHGRKRIAHDGGVPGFRATFRRFPEDDVCIVLLSNLPVRFGRIADDVEAMVFAPPSP